MAILTNNKPNIISATITTLRANVVARNLFIALAYIVAGWLGLEFFSGPPGYATPFFLPSGIAIGTVFLFWLSTLPGIFFGSFLLNVIIGYNIFHHQITFKTITAAALIAAASALQAAIGGWVFRLKLSFQSGTLVSRRNLLVLSAWAPLVCVTSSSLSVGGLWLLNTVATSDLAANWIDWWIGDTCGVLIILPWMLFLLPAEEQIKTWTQRVLDGKIR